MTDDVMRLVDDGEHYNLHDILTTNAMWCFIMGARGLGKTFGALNFCIKKYIHKKRQFIYLRRYDEDIKKIRPTFFKDMALVFPEYKFQIEGMNLQICFHPDEKKRVWETMGYIVSLNTSGSLKSVPFPQVYYIIYDEIFPNKNSQRFLSNETEIFQEFYSTVDRAQDRVKVLALSNATSVANPYFSAYKLRIEQQNKNIQIYAKGFIAVELADYKGFSAKVKRSRFGQFITRYSPDYAEYAMSNKFRDNTKDLIAELNPNVDSYNFTIETEMGEFNIWSHFDNRIHDGYYFLSNKTVKHPRMKTMVPQNVTTNKTLLRKNDEIVKRLSSAYRGGRLRFESSELQAIFIDMYGATL